MFRAFHERAMPALFRGGALELSWLEGRAGPAAALYNIRWENKVSFYQSGRVLGVPAKVRLGIVCHALAIKAAIEEGRAEYDFLAGGARYKQEFSLASRPLVTLRVIQPSLRETVRELLTRGVRAVRQLRRQG